MLYAYVSGRKSITVVKRPSKLGCFGFHRLKALVSTPNKGNPNDKKRKSSFNYFNFPPSPLPLSSPLSSLGVTAYSPPSSIMASDLQSVAQLLNATLDPRTNKEGALSPPPSTSYIRHVIADHLFRSGVGHQTAGANPRLLVTAAPDHRRRFFLLHHPARKCPVLQELCQAELDGACMLQHDICGQTLNLGDLDCGADC